MLALIPLAFWGVTWWSVSLFFGLMFGFYLLSANLANTVGDAIGYRLGQAAFRKKWPVAARPTSVGATFRSPPPASDEDAS